MIDVVLIHPNGTHGIYGPLGSDLVSREQPLWPRLIAAYLAERSYSVRIIDAEVENLSPRAVAHQVQRFDARIACLVVSGHQPSASTQAMPGARAISDELKKMDYDGLTIMMGNHPSALPEQTIREERVDFVIDGEGPTTLIGLLEHEALDKIPGLVWWDELGRINANKPAPLLDIDALHGRAWQYLPPPSQYRSHNWQRWGQQELRSPYAAIHTSLGCPYTCSFCMINVFQHTNRYRMRDPVDIVAEMVMLRYQHGVKTFKIIDELFLLNKSHVAAICDGLIKADMGDDVSIWCYGRTDTVDPNQLKMIRRAGIDWVALGIESGSEKVRDAARKHMTQESIERTVRQIEQAGIHVVGNYIFGLPGETEETMEQTLKLAMDLNTSHANFYVAMAYPGSRLYDEAIKNGWRLPSSWAGYSQHNEFTYPLVAEGTDVSAADILKFRDAAFTRYFTAPRYLKAIDQRFGEKARASIEAMTSYKLKRNLLEVPQ